MEACRLNEQLTELPFQLALIVTDWLLPILPACAENDALVDPAGTVTELGNVSGALLLKPSATADPPLEAAADNVTVQTVEACETNVVGLQASVLTVAGAVCGGGVNCNAKLWELPFSDATIFAVVAEFTAAAVTLNAALVAP